MTTPLRIRLNMWENRDDPNQTMILYDWQAPFRHSPTLNRNWRVYWTFVALNPMIPPYPDHTQLFRARHKTNYPYELIDIEPILDVFNVDTYGTYFVAYTIPVAGTVKIPLQNVYIYVEEGKKVEPEAVVQPKINGKTSN